MSKQNKASMQTAKVGVLSTITLADLQLDETKKKHVAPVGFALWIRSLLQNWRQGTVGCKDRSEVARSGKKPWKQKGTGRARAGTARSPLWRGGGVIFGPQPRTRTLSVSSKLKKNVLNALLFDYINNNRVVCLDWTLQGEAPKTAAAYAALHSAGLHNKKVTLFLSSHDMLTYTSLSNIPNVRMVFFDQANAFDLSHSDYWVFLKKDSTLFNDMVVTWI